MKVKELIEKLQKLNSEHDVKVVAYNENARCSKKCNITDANESAYYRNVNVHPADYIDDNDWR